MDFEEKNPVTIIVCGSCSKNLYKLTVMGHAQCKVMSTRMEPIGHKVYKLAENDPCPKCNGAVKRDDKYVIRSLTTGNTFNV